MSEETWLQKMDEDEFMSSFESIPGQSGLYKIDIESLLPFQRQVFIFDSEAMGKAASKFFPTAAERGYFNRGEIAQVIGKTFMAIDKERSVLIFQSGVDRNVSFEIGRKYLKGLIRYMMSDNPVKDGSFPVYDVEQTDYKAVSLKDWGHENVHIVVDPEILDEVKDQLARHDDISDLFEIAESSNHGITVLNIDKKQIGFVTPALDDWFVQIPYVTALDLHSELKNH